MVNTRKLTRSATTKSKDAKSKNTKLTSNPRKSTLKIKKSPEKQTSEESPRTLKKENLKEHTCNTCSKVFTRLDSLKQHVKIHDPDFVRVYSRDHLCHICGKKFISWCELKIHLRCHANVKVCSCDICGKAFFRTSTLNRHIRTVHTRERKFKCEYCPKTYITNSALGRHLRTHGDPSTHYPCPICARRFAHKDVLLAHEKTHAPFQVKDHQCSFCEAKFIRAYLLKQHMRIHTNEKPYVCECGKSFNQKGNLSVHQKTHEGFRKFPCKQCEKGFSRIEYLQRHEIQAHSEKPGLLPKKRSSTAKKKEQKPKKSSDLSKKSKKSSVDSKSKKSSELRDEEPSSIMIKALPSEQGKSDTEENQINTAFGNDDVEKTDQLSQNLASDDVVSNTQERESNIDENQIQFVFAHEEVEKTEPYVVINYVVEEEIIKDEMKTPSEPDEEEITKDEMKTPGEPKSGVIIENIDKPETTIDQWITEMN